MILWLACFPGAGEELVQELLYKCFKLSAEAPPDDCSKRPGDLEKFYAGLAARPDWVPVISHAPPLDSEKTLYIARNPISIIRESEGHEDVQSISRLASVLANSKYGSWGQHVRDWSPTKRSNTLTVHYERMLFDLNALVKEISKFLERPIKRGGKQAFAKKASVVSARAQHEEATHEDVEFGRAESAVLHFLYKDQLKELGYQTISRINRLQALTTLEAFMQTLGSVRSENSATGAAPESQVDRLQDRISLLQTENRSTSQALRQTKSTIAAAERTIEDLSLRNHDLQAQLTQIRAHLAEASRAVEPRFKSILTLRPLRFAYNRRSLMKRGLLNLDEEGIPLIEPPHRQEGTKAEFQVAAESITKPMIKPAEQTRSIYASYTPKQTLGVAVYAYDRGENVEHVLESLLLQNGLSNVHVWIDGDQGNPQRRARLDETEQRVGRFPVNQIHRNRGNFGFRKMMITSMRKMFEMYDRVLFLEDDCFPTRHALKGFGYELDKIEDDPNIMSVYGHPFLTESEAKGPIGRFQGWGWATTRDKLIPLWPSLLEAYLMSEDEYRDFVSAGLSKSVLNHIDVTPGRQPSDTLPKFFAWDETLGYLAGLRGQTHKRTTERLIYNFGVGESSTHFNRIDHYRKPPFNMVTIDEIWRHY